MFALFPFGHGERLIEGGHAPLQVRVIGRVDLLLHGEIANPL